MRVCFTDSDSIPHRVGSIPLFHVSSLTLISGASFPGNPFPVTRHVVTQCSNRPGGPMRLHSRTECAVNISRRKPSSHIQRPTKRSHVKTWLHSSDTKFGYLGKPGRKYYMLDYYFWLAWFIFIFPPSHRLTFIIPTMAFWGSPLGSNTFANSAMGAVPSGWAMEAITMKKCTRQHMVMISVHGNNGQELVMSDGNYETKSWVRNN